MQKGCLSCHQVNGIGGNTGVDLSEVGDRPLSEYDFSHFPEGENRTIVNWQYQHLKNPRTVVSETIMPFRAFSKTELRSLVVFVLSQKKRGNDGLLKFSRDKLAGDEVFAAFMAAVTERTDKGRAWQLPLTTRSCCRASVNSSGGSPLLAVEAAQEPCRPLHLRTRASFQRK